MKEYSVHFWDYGADDIISGETVIKAVEKNYDAIQYIAEPTEAVQLAAVRENYQALRYIKGPTDAVEAEAVRQDPQAMRLVPNLTKERALKLFSVNSYVLGYVSS